MSHPDDILRYNRHAWDRQVERGNPWTIPGGPDVIARARRGDWQIVLTPTNPFRGRLYFKVDEESRSEYLTRGMGPFRPNERQTLKSDFEVPPETLEDREALLSWARQAIRAGMEPREPGR